MTSWFPGLAGVIDKGFGGSRGGDPINGVVIHHTANGGGISALDYVANANSRNSHPTYLIQNDGDAYGIVHPDRRPFSTAGRPDSEAVSFEVDNEGGAATGWAISDAAIEKLCQIIAYHYLQSPKKGKGIARNIPGKAQPEFFVAWHSQYVATACPGPDMIAKLDRIIARAVELAGGGNVPTPAPQPPVVVPNQSYTFHMQKGDGLTYQEPDGYFGAAIQRGLIPHGYDTQVNAIDGVWGINTRKSVQRAARLGGYKGPIDGLIGKNTIKGVQTLARNGGYTGPIDGVPGINTWTGFKKALGQ